MTIYWVTGLALLAGYLLGSINTSILVGRMYGIDIREKGSGNAGATNTLRTLGRKAALLVLLGDILKSVSACLAGLLAAHIAGLAGQEASLALMAGGIGAILGHNWPIYFQFRGGKGILASFTVVLMVDYRGGLILLGIFLAVLVLFRYVSLGSLAAAALLPGIFLLLGHGPWQVLFAVLTAILAIFRHRANIGRLLAGTESRVNFRKKPSAPGGGNGAKDAGMK